MGRGAGGASRARASLTTTLSRLAQYEFDAKRDAKKPASTSRASSAGEGAAADDKTFFNDASEGCVKWRDGVIHTELPPEPDRLIQSMRGQLDRLEATVAKLAKGVKTLVETSQLWANEVGNFASAFREHEAVEADLGDPLKTECVNRDYKHLAPALSSELSLFDSWTQAVHYQPAILETVLRAALQYLLQQVGAMRELLKIREDGLRELQKLEQKLKAHHDERSSGRKETRSTFGSLTKAKQSLDEMIAQEELDVRQQRLYVGVLSRALFYSEIERFNEERRELLLEMFGELGASHLHFAQQLKEMWLRAMGEMHFDLEAEREKAKWITAWLPTTGVQREADAAGV